VRAELRAHHEFRTTEMGSGGSDFAAALEQVQIETKRYRNQLFHAEKQAASAKELDDDLKLQVSEAL